jgi:type VII secretion-associated serine protease mycosin
VGGRLATAGLLASGLVVLTAPPSVAEECNAGQTSYVSEPSAALVNLGVPQSWRLATGDGVTVAVVDSGVEMDNQHLGPDVVLPGTTFISGPGVSPEGRNDQLGHGTAIAGIVAAREIEDQSALVGVAYDARILPVQVFQYDPQPGQQVPNTPDTALMARGIRWAVDNGADVINVSMSADRRDPALGQLKAALDHAYDQDVVVVASAGNNTPNSDNELESTSEPRWPAAHPKVIGVAAANASGVVDDYTIHGPGTDVAAPGANVLISFRQYGDCVAGKDRPYSSWAAGFVSGLAAQLRERYPRASVDEIRYRILASADRPRLGERDDIEGWGLIRPYDALAMTIDPTVPGPPLPGRLKRSRPEATRDVEALAAPVDPWADARSAALWWGLGGLGVTALALILRPAARRRTSHA